MKKLLLLSALVALAGCETIAGGGAPVGHRIQWRCDDGAAFSVSFTSGAAQVFAGGQTYRLPHVRAASGARYSNGAVEYWEHAGQAVLNGARGGPYNNCRHG